MSIYVMAQLSFTNLDAYRRYQNRFMTVLKQFGGSLLVADEAPVVLEGAWGRDKIVLMSFADQAAFELGRTHRSMRRSRRIARRAQKPSCC
jgi:uncharacterized protein (DUF1330 family)